MVIEASQLISIQYNTKNLFILRAFHFIQPQKQFSSILFIWGDGFLNYKKNLHIFCLCTFEWLFSTNVIFWLLASAMLLFSLPSHLLREELLTCLCCSCCQVDMCCQKWRAYSITVDSHYLSLAAALLTEAFISMDLSWKVPAKWAVWSQPSLVRIILEEFCNSIKWDNRAVNSPWRMLIDTPINAVHFTCTVCVRILSLCLLLLSPMDLPFCCP